MEDEEQQKAMEHWSSEWCQVGVRKV